MLNLISVGYQRYVAMSQHIIRQYPSLMK